MRIRYDYLEGKFGAWTKLKNKIGNVYDPVSNKFNITEEEWELKSKANKFVDSLRNTRLLFSNLCVQLFDEVACTGFESWGLSSTFLHPSKGNVDPDLNEDDGVHHTSTK